ncbi:MAG TPA: hypothetical protein VK194_09370 [Candidatus Deferrimicrobium sp.]|nr:hypothetical protein [Candidatus Deferrimicrobium sp.]
MKKSTRRSPADRDRAVARLRALTIGTGVAGLAAVGGFGAIAAASYDGGAAGITTAAIVSADGSTTATGASTTGTTTTGTTTTTATSGTTSVQATAAPTAATGTAHAATGSS